MARRFPEDPEFPPGRAAEAVVFETLADNLPDEAAVFWSIPFTDDDGETEADVIVAWPAVGVAVIEVKGGHVSLRHGEWMQSGHRLRRSPILQAQDARHAMLRYLKRRPEWPWRRPRSVHLAAFPFTGLPADFSTPEAERHRLLDRGDCHAAPDRVRLALERANQNLAPPDLNQVNRLIDILEVSLPSGSDLLGDIEEQNAYGDLLTHQQWRLLDAMKANRRIEVRGGAGTGKTWLALEKVRRLSAAGERVALLCHSQPLARHLQRETSKWRRRERPDFVGTVRDLAAAWTRSGGTDDHLADSLAAAGTSRPPGTRFDSLVIDEVQDIESLWYLPLASTLKDRATGGLFVFVDPTRHQDTPPPARPPFKLVLLDLPDNVRNSRQIAQAFGGLALAPMHYRGPAGEPVRFQPARPQDVIPTADAVVRALLNEGWPPQTVALLTTGAPHPAQARQVQQLGPDGYWDQLWTGKSVFHARAIDFKGLERPAVVLAVNGLSGPQALETLYVGLSRARSRLVVVGEPALIQELGGPAIAHPLDNAR